MEDYTNENRSEEIKPQKPTLRSRIENFFYHYKWHTLIALFLVITVTVCSVQMCEKESYDMYVIYAGGKEISKTAKDGNIPDYITMSKSLARAAGDYNGDGQVTLTLDTLFLLSADEIAKKNEELKAEGGKEEINQLLISENAKTLNDRMLYSEYYACLMSEEMYKLYTEKNGFKFSDLSAFVQEGSEVEYYDGTKTAVYLKSTGMSKLPVLCDLPDDTLIVLRSLSEVSNTFGKEENRENYARSEQFVKNMLNY